MMEWHLSRRVKQSSDTQGVSGKGAWKHGHCGCCKVCFVVWGGRGRRFLSCSAPWANNFGITSGTNAGLEGTMKELIQDIFRNKMEPKRASLWWTGTCAGVEDKTLVDNFDLIGYKYKRNGKSEAGVARTLKRYDYLIQRSAYVSQ